MASPPHDDENRKTLSIAQMELYSELAKYAQPLPAPVLGDPVTSPPTESHPDRHLQSSPRTGMFSTTPSTIPIPDPSQDPNPDGKNCAGCRLYREKCNKFQPCNTCLRKRNGFCIYIYGLPKAQSRVASAHHPNSSLQEQDSSATPDLTPDDLLKTNDTKSNSVSPTDPMQELDTPPQEGYLSIRPESQNLAKVDQSLVLSPVENLKANTHAVARSEWSFMRCESNIGYTVNKLLQGSQQLPLDSTFAPEPTIQQAPGSVTNQDVLIQSALNPQIVTSSQLNMNPQQQSCLQLLPEPDFPPNNCKRYILRAACIQCTLCRRIYSPRLWGYRFTESRAHKGMQVSRQRKTLVAWVSGFGTISGVALLWWGDMKNQFRDIALDNSNFHFMGLKSEERWVHALAGVRAASEALNRINPTEFREGLEMVVLVTPCSLVYGLGIGQVLPKEYQTEIWNELTEKFHRRILDVESRGTRVCFHKVSKEKNSSLHEAALDFLQITGESPEGFSCCTH